MYYQSHAACMETNKSITLICFDKHKYNFWVFNNYISQSHWSWHVAVCYLEKGKQVFTSPGWLLMQPEREGVFTFVSPTSSMGKAVKGRSVLCPGSIPYPLLEQYYVQPIVCSHSIWRSFVKLLPIKMFFAALLDWYKSTDQVSSPNPFQSEVKQGYWKHLSKGFNCSAFLWAEMV